MIDLHYVRGVKLIFLWEQMLGMEMAQPGQLIGVVVLSKILIQQYVLLDFFQKKVMVCMWQGMILPCACRSFIF